MKHPLFTICFLFFALGISAQGKVMDIKDCDAESYVKDNIMVYVAANDNLVIHLSAVPSGANLIEFWIEVFNTTGELATLKPSDFILIDAGGHQFEAFSPAQIREAYDSKEEKYAGQAYLTQNSPRRNLNQADRPCTSQTDEYFDYGWVKPGSSRAGIIAFEWIVPWRIKKLVITIRDEPIFFTLKMQRRR